MLGKDPGQVHSYSMLVAYFDGLMAVPTDPAYCSCILTPTTIRLPSKTRTTLTPRVVLPEIELDQLIIMC